MRKSIVISRSLVGFRSIVVHEYLAVDLRLVDEVLRERRYRRVLLLAEKLLTRLSAEA